MAVQLLTNILQHARRRPDAPAIAGFRWFGEGAAEMQRTTWSYGQLAATISVVAQRIAAHTPESGVVLLAQPNGFEFTAMFLGTLAAGRTVFPVSPHLAASELTEAAGQAGVLLALVADAQASSLAGQSDIECHEIGTFLESGVASETIDPQRAGKSGMYLLSSGTTARPRIVDRRAGALDAVAENIARYIGDSTHRGLLPDDRVLGVIPQCHSYGVENALLGPLFAGACLVLCQRFDTMLVRELWSQGEVSVFPATPAMLDMLARTGDGAVIPVRQQCTSLVRRCPCVYSAGASLPADVALAFEQRFGAPVGQLYGASEAGSVTFVSGDERPAATCVGPPFTGIHVRIVQPDQAALIDVPVGTEGEVVIRADSMLSRYVGAGDACTVDGFWRSGDMGRYDKAGHLHITGRLKLLIDVGPEKVNPLEIEAALREHPGVMECVVTPVQVTETVNRLRAVVVPKVGATTTAEDLRHFLRDRLSAYKIPRLFEFRTDLPRSPTGKVLRREL